MIEGYKMIKEAAGQRNIRPRTLRASGILGCDVAGSACARQNRRCCEIRNI